MITPRRIEEAAAALRDGALIVAPTDTVYGVCAHYDVAAAVDALFTVKGRPDHKPIPLLLSDADALARLGVTLTPPEKRLADAFWPGPLTLIVRTPFGTEGVRVPDHEGMRMLLRAVEGVLRVTSANRSGEPPALTAAEARRVLGKRVAMVLDGGPVTGGIPSSVVKVQAGQLTVLREGALSTAALREAAGL